jgi:hypothetical protein
VLAGRDGTVNLRSLGFNGFKNASTVFDAERLVQSQVFQRRSTIVRLIATETMRKAGMNNLVITAAWMKAQMDYLEEAES